MGLDEFIRPGFLQIAAPTAGVAVRAAATNLQKGRYFGSHHLLIEKYLQKGRHFREFEPVVRISPKKTVFSQAFRSSTPIDDKFLLVRWNLATNVASGVPLTLSDAVVSCVSTLKGLNSNENTFH
ncbi:hypothetical protein ABE504_00920 [Paenibacillus oryzisoli]|uniref:hypothetical protein n=1 Tax=Paenibacillus oryzisoli TaxID=1850517 RepID=UPI003D2C53E6